MAWGLCVLHGQPSLDSMKQRVVLVHDYLTQRGGAERVLLAMAATFPGARIVTSFYDPDATFPEFRELDIETLGLGRWPVLRADPRRAMPLLAQAWDRHVVDDADVVVCSSSGWAHGVRTAAPKIVYCHNPARWLYQTDDYLGALPRSARVAFATATRGLRSWDRQSARSADMYLANSTAVAARIRQAYGHEALVLPPPTSMAGGPEEPMPGIEPGYWLTVGRRRGYKNTDLVADAFARLPSHRLIAVGGLSPRADGTAWPDNLTGLTDVSDAQLRWLYRNARALVAMSHEDFGLTPIEAYAHGTPALVLRAGGYLDTTVPGLTGEFVPQEDVHSLRVAVSSFKERKYDRADIESWAERYSMETFGQNLKFCVAEVRDPSRTVVLPRHELVRIPA